MSLGDLFEELECSSDNTKDRYEIQRAPFAWPGGKSRSIKHLLDILPYRDVWVEVCGGSGVVTLNRKPSKLEVFNDRDAGVTAFYRCIRNKDKSNQLADWLEATIHSREDWVWCKETWENCQDDVERAGRWLYLITYSFGSIGRNFGRAINPPGNFAGKLREKCKYLSAIHHRFKNIQVENLDAIRCLKDYDSPKTVFYIDPDYNTDRGLYKNKMDAPYHRRLLDQVFSCSGYVAVSGYTNPLFESNDWDARYCWESFASIQSVAGVGNCKEHIVNQKRASAEEVLWVKEAS